jgi:hypothetical protein
MFHAPMLMVEGCAWAGVDVSAKHTQAIRSKHFEMFGLVMIRLRKRSCSIGLSIDHGKNRKNVSMRTLQTFRPK